ncbi:MAG: SGNH/GDSL hydrolase family protein [Deltaproteobacteria bacterium]|nr:MAG: SGNH/GDSL hydrolase family protein [Deltaproteobacteria bacterium]
MIPTGGRDSAGRRNPAVGRSGGRRAIIGILVAVAVMLGVEGLARLLTGPPEIPVVVRMPDGSEGLFEEQEGRLHPRLPEHAAWWPRGPKQAGHPRIVLLGGSSLAGPPSDRRLAAWRLAERFDAEVVDLAVGGMDTAHLVATLPGALSLDPDLVLIYSGHNDLGNAVFSRRFADPGAVAVARARQVLGHSRVFSLLEALWRGREERHIVVQWDQRDMALTEAEKALVLAEYERRMSRIVHQVREAGVPVVLSTVVSNAFFPSVHWQCPERLEALGVTPSRTAILPLDGVDPDAVEAARAAAPCRDLDQVAARLMWDRDRAAAVDLLERLRDGDPKPLRAPRAVNDAIRRIAVQQGAVLADTAREWKRRGGGVEPPLWFRDPVHMSAVGHEALAAAWVPAVAEALGLAAPDPGWPDPLPRAATSCLSPRCPRGRRR